MSYGRDNPRPCPWCSGNDIGTESVTGLTIGELVARCYDCGAECPPRNSASVAMRVWNVRDDCRVSRYRRCHIHKMQTLRRAW